MKPGPKPKSPNGLPKRHYGTNLALDVIAVIREQPNQAEFLERLVRADAGWNVGDEAIWTPQAFGPYRVTLRKLRQVIWLIEFNGSRQAYANADEAELTPCAAEPE